MVLEVRWTAGRIVRNFTLLLDPPKSSEAAKAAETLAAPVLVDEPKTSDKATSQKSTPHTVVVVAGDTAGAIANQTKPNGTSVEQMLIALQQSNPAAFINNNINQIRAGAVLTLPDQADIQKINAQDAAEAVKAQAQTFNDRRNAAAQAAAAKSATGDQLTLSKGASLEQAELAKIAKDLSQKDEAAQTAELAKNIADLNQLAQAAVALSAPPAAAASSPALATSAPAIEKSVPSPVSKDYTTEGLFGGALVLFGALWWYRNKQTPSAWTPEPEPLAKTEPQEMDSVQTAAKAMGFDLSDLSLDLEPPKSGPQQK
jgi:pilus assembly protein FimV